PNGAALPSSARPPTATPIIAPPASAPTSTVTAITITPSISVVPRVATERFDEGRQPFRKFVAAGQVEPALLHFKIILDCRCAQGCFSQPLAFLRTAKALANFFAEVLERGASPKTTAWSAIAKIYAQ